MHHSALKGMAAGASILAGLAASTTGAHATVNFTTFVTSGAIDAVEGQTNVIAFNYTGTGFVGSVYFGSENDQLFSTNLTGGNVQHYGQPLGGATPFSGEVVVGVGLGQAGFAKGAVYAGDGSTGRIDYVPASGAPVLFGTVPVGNVRQIFFDPGSNFGGEMLVTTTSGNIYKFDSSGTPTFLADVGEDAEGMDIAPSDFGPYAGDLLVSSEGTGTIRAITPGAVSVVATGLTEAETVSAVPLNLGASGNPVEGFYVANYPFDIQKAGASEFAGLQGDVIVTGEFGGGNSPVTDLHWNGSAIVETLVGNLPNQSEDGIFVTDQRIQLVGTPEPSTWAMMLLGFAGLGFAGYRKAKSGRAVHSVI
jgi:hypothetical protein